MNPSRSGYSIPENEVLNKLKIGIERQFETNKSSAEKLLWEMEDLIRETYDRIENEAIRTVYEPLFDVALDAIETSKDASLILPFFTTNYDMSIDWFLRPDHRDNRPQHQEWLHKRRMKMDYVDGFDRDEWSEDVYASSYEPDMITVEYHKLHGSLRWQNVDGVIKRGTSVARDRLMNQKLVIVYPSDKKILTENPFYFCHKKLDEHLMRSDNLIVIGFSFRDPAIVQALNYALLYNTKLVVHIIHPKYEPSDYPEMDSFIKLHKGGDSSSTKHRVGEYINSYMWYKPVALQCRHQVCRVYLRLENVNAYKYTSN